MPPKKPQIVVEGWKTITLTGKHHAFRHVVTDWGQTHFSMCNNFYKSNPILEPASAVPISHRCMACQRAIAKLPVQ